VPAACAYLPIQASRTSGSSSLSSSEDPGGIMPAVSLCFATALPFFGSSSSSSSSELFGGSIPALGANPAGLALHLLLFLLRIRRGSFAKLLRSAALLLLPHDAAGRPACPGARSSTGRALPADDMLSISRAKALRIYPEHGWLSRYPLPAAECWEANTVQLASPVNAVLFHRLDPQIFPTTCKGCPLTTLPSRPAVCLSCSWSLPCRFSVHLPMGSGLLPPALLAQRPRAPSSRPTPLRPLTAHPNGVTHVVLG